jgi:hypothetical protein
MPPGFDKAQSALSKAHLCGRGVGVHERAGQAVSLLLHLELSAADVQLFLQVVAVLVGDDCGGTRPAIVLVYPAQEVDVVVNDRLASAAYKGPRRLTCAR